MRTCARAHSKGEQVFMFIEIELWVLLRFKFDTHSTIQRQLNSAASLPSYLQFCTIIESISIRLQLRSVFSLIPSRLRCYFVHDFIPRQSLLEADSSWTWKASPRLSGIHRFCVWKFNVFWIIVVSFQYATAFISTLEIYSVYNICTIGNFPKIIHATIAYSQ